MKKGMMKRIIASVLSLALVLGLSGFVMGAGRSHAPNGSNVVPANLRWDSFSVRDDLWGGPMTDWEQNLLKEMDKEKKQAKKDLDDGKITPAQYEEKIKEIDGYQSYTQGYIPTNMPNNPSSVSFLCVNTGWDGEYNQGTLTGDNPYGLWLRMPKIPVEFNRYYTVEFDISTDLENKENQESAIKQRIDKHAMLKVFDYQTKSQRAADFESFEVDGEEGSLDGTFAIKKTPINNEAGLVQTHVKATFKIPATTEEWSGGKDNPPYTYAAVRLYVGSFIQTYPEENAASGYIYVKDLKVIAGNQFAAKYYDGTALKATKYVNPYEKAPWVALKKKGKTLDYYTNGSAKYNFNSLVESNLNLKAHWITTPKPKKASLKLKSKKKKRVTVTFGKNANAKGYQVKYSFNKKFKKKSKYKTKTKTTTKTTTYTIKSSKSSRVMYVKARAFNRDSCGNKVYGKWGKRKVVYVK